MPGDLFNNMQIISTKVVNAVSLCLQQNLTKYQNIKIIAISGNHDMAEKNLIDSPAESALDYLHDLFTDRFILLDKSIIFTTNNGHVIYGLPYFEYPEHFRKALETASEYFNLKNGYTSFLLMHQVVGSGLPIEDHISPNDPLFDNFTMVFNGHIHDGSQLTDKFINVGAPMARDAGDIGKKRGFWIVDLDDSVSTISFKEITIYPQFIHKTVGDTLTEWEQVQYVIWVPAETAENTNDNLRNEKFNNTLAPKEILANYCAEVLPVKELDEKLKYGVSLL
jgi:DNA repair exonuclease SbcCD nuclease subunit